MIRHGAAAALPKEGKWQDIHLPSAGAKHTKGAFRKKALAGLAYSALCDNVPEKNGMRTFLALAKRQPLEGWPAESPFGKPAAKEASTLSPTGCRMHLAH